MNKATTHSSSILRGLLKRSNPVEKEKARIKMLIAVNIDEAIKRKNWSRSKLADELNLRSRSLVTKWLGGTHNFTTDTLIDICFKLDIKIESLFSRPSSEKSKVITFTTSKIVSTDYTCDFEFEASGSFLTTKISGQQIKLQSDVFERNISSIELTTESQ